MLPFIVDMGRLYERFVAEWLQRHMDKQVRLQRQERYAIGRQGALHFVIDLVLYDRVTGQVRCVLDTKYKAPGAMPDAADIAQIIAYAQAKAAPEAILIYPVELAEPVDATVNQIRVRTLTFPLDGDLENAGQRFLQSLAIGKNSH